MSQEPKKTILQDSISVPVSTPPHIMTPALSVQSHTVTPMHPETALQAEITVLVVFCLLCGKYGRVWKVHANIQLGDGDLDPKADEVLYILLKRCWNFANNEMSLDTDSVYWNALRP